MRTARWGVGSFFRRLEAEDLKVLFLSAAFFLIIGAYALVNELKSSVFIQIAGTSSIPYARVYSMLGLVPLILFYSRLVDSIKRYQLLYFYSIVYAVAGFVFAYFLNHPTIGLPNTEVDPKRLFGWLFYFFIEGYSPFVVSVFWSFANSVSNPDSAKKHYAIIVAASKLGAVFCVLMAWWLLTPLASTGQTLFSDIANIQILLVCASMLLMAVPVTIYLLMKLVPGQYLHGYEAVYRFERQREKLEERKKRSWKQALHAKLVGMVSGLTLFIKQPYVLGIFGMVFFYDVIYVVFSYLRLTNAKAECVTTSGMTCLLFKQTLIVQFLGLIIALFGTQRLMSYLGERLCLLLIPAISGACLLYVLASYSSTSIFVGFVVLRALNYGFTQPVRESLYIPTVKDLKFKSKSWIDAFGSKFAKTTGSFFNILVNQAGSAWLMPLHASFFISILSVWLATAFMLGRRYDTAIANNEVIGSEDEVVI